MKILILRMFLTNGKNFHHPGGVNASFASFLFSEKRASLRCFIPSTPIMPKHTTTPRCTSSVIIYFEAMLSKNKSGVGISAASSFTASRLINLS